MGSLQGCLWQRTSSGGTLKLRAMPGSLPVHVAFLTDQSSPFDRAVEPGRPPRQLTEALWLFAPNRAAQGGSSWLLQGDAQRGQPDLLVDCPAYTEANLELLDRRAQVAGASGGLIVLTGRDGHGELRRLQQRLGWPVLVQEQEAYLLPGVEQLEAFAETLEPAPGVRLLWTPGPSPGACVVHVQRPGVDGLFCGRLLVPLAPGRLAPLQTPRTFHWPRQLASVQRLRAWLPQSSPDWLATGAALGALRGQHLVANAAELLKSLAP